MVRTGFGVWGRVVRDPYTLLLGAAAAIQATLGSSSADVLRPGWAVAGVGGFLVACLCAIFGRLRNSAVLRTIAPFVLLIVAACWRAADDFGLAGFGGLCIVAVVWLGFYGTRGQVWTAVIGSALALLVAPVLAGTPIVADDWRRAALTGALALLIGPTVRSLVERGTRTAALVSALEPASSQLDAVLRAGTGHMIIACGADGIITEFNQGAERLLGYRADEVIGIRTPLFFHDPEETAELAAELDMEPGLAAYLRAAASNEGEVTDWRYLTKDGRHVTVSLSMSCVRDPAGEVTGYIGIGTDVTASRKTMQTLATQRALYQSLVEHLPLTTVGLFDSELRCVTLGGHWLHKVGTEAGSVRGTQILDFFAPADRERARRLYTRALSEQVTDTWELADGRTYEFSALPLPGPDGEHLALSLARDVSEQREQQRESQRVHAALAVSEASFREAFEGAPIGMALLRVENWPDERFLEVNPAFAAILGRRPEDLIGTRVADVTHPEDVALVPDLSGTGRARTLRKRFMRPSGRAVWVEVNYAIVRDADGKPSHIIKQIQDIHAIKESERALLDALEQQRAATARLRELDRIRTDLVGTISHELRTPLTSIHGYLELLADEVLTPTQRGMLDVAVRNTERLADLVDNLLVLVRLDSVDDTSPAGSDDVDVAGAVSAAIDTVRPEFVDRGQQLEVALPIGAATVRGDFDQIDRVLVNLLSNASKYTPAGGRIDVTVEVRAGQVRISVSDTGIGIPPDELPNLFTRFFRASTARKNSISGNGLGLAIVKSIVERHGGEVGVVSEPNAGSTFTVTLPLAAQVESRPAAARSPYAVGGAAEAPHAIA